VPAGSSSVSVDSNLVPFLDLLAELIARRIVAQVTSGGTDLGAPPSQHPENATPTPAVPAETQGQYHSSPKPAARRTARGGAKETP